MDQRGTGQSKPLVAWPAPDSLPTDAFLSREKMLAYLRQATPRAIESFTNRGIDLTGYNSNESADDLNDLRLALGAEKISLLGFSYGTHLALATIRRYAAHIDSVVLAGTEGPNNTLKLPSTYDAQLHKLSDLAARDPEVGSKVPDLVALLKRILAKLEKEPLTVRIRDLRKNQMVDVQDGYRSRIFADARTLFISGTLDSNTPPYQAEETRWGFSNSAHIIVDYAGHEQTLPNEEVQAAVIDFFNSKDTGNVRFSLGRPKFRPIP
jgi:pimeloyl-ACP methyl ester carboxylesterase